MQKATLRQAIKALDAFGDISGEHFQRIIASGLLADLRDGIVLPDRDEFRRLCGLDPIRQQDWRVWMTLIVGGVPKGELLARLKENGCYVTPGMQDLMRKSAFTTAAEPYQIPLVLVKVRDLGFIKPPTTTQLFARAEQGMLNLCPAETGPHLRLAPRSRPSFWVASDRIIDFNGDPLIFRVSLSAGGTQCLDMLAATPLYRWELEEQFVFQLRK